MNVCRICGSERPSGCTETCGRSLCQEAAYLDNAARAARKGSVRRAGLFKEAQERAEQAARFVLVLEPRGYTS